GETYAQILSLLGVRSLTPRRPNSPHWEIIPSNELERPRVDVVVTICGFFRDLFSNLIDELDDILHAVAALDEPADINPLAARTRQQAQAMRQSGEPEERIEALAHARIFGPPPGQYGSGLTDIVDSGQWQSPEDLATAFTAASGHVYTRYDHGSHTDGLYDSRLKDVDLVSQTRSSNEYEITDLDHYFEY
ncbi:cobaltochelatase subunit CobN, partial [Cutibacterium acnes]